MSTILKASPVALASLLMLSACGGGGGSTSSTGGSTTTTTQTSSLNGVIQGRGSIVMNGIRCGTSGATIRDDDGVTYNSSDLQIGQVVSTDCAFDPNTNTGEATNIVLKREFAGQIDTVGSGTFTLLGQTIAITTTTFIEGSSTFAAGQYVEVYGLRDGNGNIQATYVENKGLNPNPIPKLEGRGVISNLDTNADTFQIGSLIVDYSGLTGSFSESSLQNGLLVRFTTTDPNDYTAGSTTVRPEVIQVKSYTQEYNGFGRGEVEIKGYVDSDANDSNPNTFTVSQILVDIGNLSASEKALFDPQSNVLLEVEGTFTNNTLIAREAEREDDRSSRRGGSFEFYGVATNGQLANGTLSFEIQGYQVDFSTNSDICGITTGTPYVEVKGNLQNGQITATRVECEDQDDDDDRFGDRGFEISGQATGYNSGTRQFSLRGITVQVTDSTVFEDGVESGLASNPLVEVKGTQSGNVMNASKIEFEDD